MAAVGTGRIIKVMLLAAAAAANLGYPVPVHPGDLPCFIHSKILRRILFPGLVFPVRLEEFQLAAFGTAVHFHLIATPEAEIKITDPCATITLLKGLPGDIFHGNIAAQALQIQHQIASTASMTLATPSVLTDSIKPLS
jgi:hypothetical protein